MEGRPSHTMMKMVLTVSGTGIFTLSHTYDPGKVVCSRHVIRAFPVGEFTSLLTCIVALTSVPMAS